MLIVVQQLQDTKNVCRKTNLILRWNVLCCLFAWIHKHVTAKYQSFVLIYRMFAQTLLCRTLYRKWCGCDKKSHSPDRSFSILGIECVSRITANPENGQNKICRIERSIGADKSELERQRNFGAADWQHVRSWRCEASWFIHHRRRNGILCWKGWSFHSLVLEL